MAPRVQLVSTLSVFWVSIRTLSPRNLNSYSTKLTKVRPMHVCKRVVVWVNLHCLIHFPSYNLKSLQPQDCPHSLHLSSVQSLSRVWLFVTAWTAARQAFLSITSSQSLLKLMYVELVMPSNHLIHYHPLLLPPSIFPSIRVFSNEAVLRIRWSKCWSFQLQHQFFQGIFRTDFL